MNEQMLRAKALELSIQFWALVPEQLREDIFRKDSDGRVVYELKPIVAIADGFIREYIKKQ